jgi:hypothetical protein
MTEPENEFARAASEKQAGFLAELWGFLRTNSRWWLTPIVIVMVLLAVLFVLAGTGAAPFIYTLF